MGNLSDVKAGDEVIVQVPGYFGHTYFYKTAVERATKNIIVADGATYFRENGRECNPIDVECRPRIIRLIGEETAEYIAQVERQREEDERVSSLRAYVRRYATDLSTSALERIAAIIKAERGEE
jgi:hypothetical protein